MTAEVFTKHRIERNRATSQFKRLASRNIRAEWDQLCDKANLNTMVFWKFHNKLKGGRNSLVEVYSMVSQDKYYALMRNKAEHFWQDLSHKAAIMTMIAGRYSRIKLKRW